MFIFQWLRKIISRIVSLGVTEQNTILEVQMLKMFNASCLIALLFILPYPLLNILLLKVPLNLPTIIIPPIAFSFYTFLLFLTAKGRIYLAKILFIFVSFFFLIGLATYLGHDSGLHLYLLTSVVVPFYILKEENKKLLFGAVAAIFCGYFIALWYNSNFMPMIVISEKMLKLAYYINSVFVLLWFVLVGYANYKLNNLAQKKLSEEKEKSENLLLNILPKKIAYELKEKGHTNPQYFDSVTVLFTDFHGFTQVAESMSPKELVDELDKCFSYFDSLMDRYNLEKLKTIGDSYMCAGGLPIENNTHFIDTLLVALEIQRFMTQMKEIRQAQDSPYWELRLGIHTGHLVAGVIGQKKFAYDIWGDTVNIASRMESSGANGKINISHETYELVKDYFDCEYRGKVLAKNKGEVSMYFVSGISAKYSVDEKGLIPNKKLLSIIRK